MCCASENSLQTVLKPASENAPYAEFMINTYQQLCFFCLLSQSGTLLWELLISIAQNPFLTQESRLLSRNNLLPTKYLSVNFIFYKM